MPLKSVHDLLLAQLHDLYSAELQCLDTIPRIASTATNEFLGKALNEHLEETREHVARLSEMLSTLNAKPKVVTCRGMQGLLEEAAKSCRAAVDPLVRDAAIVAALQKVERYEITAYASARAFAELLGLADVSQLLGQSLEEEAFADQGLADLAEYEVNPHALTGVVVGAGAS
jgi:ferritin-like metal-binding protein YciE